ncbi:hypothetical protein CW751_08955 [Brumimicrobium salinarum]|uniref:Outer membrane protein beta-barrel domain-containing protein n=1 Tax=Brumimicrobium salinarum TaxID=2058658 RepID=A0A2I0R1R3_9FLAO|nr:porin family protein [Brumimicrobium salinarum]PKR80495.1 hypothetical protein CW751_08955 [Brumimicrobium salinarum]
MKIVKIIITISLGLTLAPFVSAQKYTVHKNKKSYIAVHGGFNFSIPHVSDRYAILSPQSEEMEKDYGKLGKNTGAQFGIRYSYNFTNALAINAGIGYQSFGFKYRTDYSWNDTIAQQNLTKEMHHEQKVSYFSIPVMVRWDFSRQQFMPYAQAGISFDFRHQSKKSIHQDQIIDEKITESQFSSLETADMTEHIRKFNMGIMAGIGIEYYTKFFTFGVESNFKYGFFKLVNDENRYADMTGFAMKYLDVLDQLKLSNWNVQFTLAIPINHSVKTNILRKRRY